MEVIIDERTKEEYLARSSADPRKRRRRIVATDRVQAVGDQTAGGVVDSEANDLFVRTLGTKKGLTNQPKPLGK